MTSAPDILAWLVLLALMAAITLRDLRTHRIPNALSALLLLSGFAAAWLTGMPHLSDAALGAVLGGSFLLAMAVGFRRLRGRDGLGLGDVKFLAGAGAWAGWQGIGPILFIAATSALLVLGAQAMAGARPARDTPIAFGPYLCLGLVAVRALQAGTGLWP